MLPRVALVLLVAGAGCGMRTRETVERMVMVRTTGSDLQPAATGYVYKKKNDGEESVVEMGESEIMQRLSQFYEHPKEFPGLERASAEHGSETGGASGERRIIPVSEKEEDRADGLADEDYEKIFNDYTPTYRNDGYRDYLRSLKRFHGGLYHEYSEGRAEDDAGHYSDHHGDPELYHKRKSESFSATGPVAGSRDDDDRRSYHERTYHEDKPTAYHDGETGSGFHKIYDNKKDYNDREYVGEKVKAFPDARKYYGTFETEHNGGPYESHHDDKLGRAAGGDAGAARSSEGGDHSTTEHHGDYASSGSRAPGGSFGFDVQH